jgi:hypothetical protein
MCSLLQDMVSRGNCHDYHYYHEISVRKIRWNLNIFVPWIFPRLHTHFYWSHHSPHKTMLHFPEIYVPDFYPIPHYTFKLSINWPAAVNLSTVHKCNTRFDP